MDFRADTKRMSLWLIYSTNKKVVRYMVPENG